MKKSILNIGCFLLVITIIYSCTDNLSEVMKNAPKLKKKKKELTIHNQTRIDNYFWLNERENPEVIKYLEDENEYTNRVLESTLDTQDKIYSEITSRIKKTDMSVPYELRGYTYYTKYEDGSEYPIYARKKINSNIEEILLNVNELKQGHSFINVVGLKVSPDNNLLAFGVDTLSRRKYQIQIKDLSTGKLLNDKIENTTGSVAWANDNKTFFFTRKDSTLRAYKIFKHKLKSEIDKEIYHESDSTYSTYVYNSKSGKFIFILSSSTMANEYQYLKADNPDGKFKTIIGRVRGHEYDVYHLNNNFLIRTNKNATNFKLVKTPIGRSSEKYWTEIIPHNENVLLQNVSVFKNFIAISEKENGLTNIKVKSLNSDVEFNVDFGEEVYSARIGYNPELNSNKLRYNFSSLKTPSSTFEIDMSSKKKELLKQTEVLGGYNSSNYETKRLFATARDGIKVPISLIYKKGITLDGNNPLLIYGYGSYGASMSAGFKSSLFSLIDRGFVYAIAHIRGGQEMGRQWYENGKLLNKKNTFTDFIDCAEYLIASKYTNPTKLFAKGGSAGGLLMGAIVNMRPDLFRGVIANVPFVDVITTMLDESIPLTTGEFDEWGNPKIEKYYNYILSYSPYDNVEAKDYPNLLVTTGLHDSQVQYWEPAKWVAKMREFKTDNNILLLKTNMNAGHGGASGRFEKYKLTALEYAFILMLIND